MSAEKPQKPAQPVQGERPGAGVVVSDELLRRLREQGGRVTEGPKGPVKSA